VADLISVVILIFFFICLFKWAEDPERNGWGPRRWRYVAEQRRERERLGLSIFGEVVGPALPRAGEDQEDNWRENLDREYEGLRARDRYRCHDCCCCCRG